MHLLKQHALFRAWQHGTHSLNKTMVYRRVMHESEVSLDYRARLSINQKVNIKEMKQKLSLPFKSAF